MTEHTETVPHAGRYSWGDLEPGKPRLYPYGERDPMVVQKRIYEAGRRWCERNRPDLRCRTRQLDEGLKVWLVSKEEA